MNKLLIEIRCLPAVGTCSYVLARSCFDWLTLLQQRHSSISICRCIQKEGEGLLNVQTQCDLVSGSLFTLCGPVVSVSRYKARLENSPRLFKSIQFIQVQSVHSCRVSVCSTCDFFAALFEIPCLCPSHSNCTGDLSKPSLCLFFLMRKCMKGRHCILIQKLI